MDIPEKDKEDIFAKATLNSKTVTIGEVPCKLFLPNDILKKPRVVITPHKSQEINAFLGKPCELRIELKKRLGNIERRIYSPEMWLTNAKIHHCDPGVSDLIVEGEPANLSIVDQLHDPKPSLASHFIFWISPNKFLSPAIGTSTSFKGWKRIRRAGILKCKIKRGFLMYPEINFAVKDKFTILVRDKLTPWRFPNAGDVILKKISMGAQHR